MSTVCRELQTLANIWQTLQDNKEIEKNDRVGMNLFKVLRIQNKEVLICRLLGELLDPLGSHEMGIIPLSSFLSIIKANIYSNKQLENASVILEEVIDENRRVDIAIHLASDIIPIEVKVWAGDQAAQLTDYYRFYFGEDSSKRIYYLTPHGHTPSETSQGNLRLGVNIQCLSFANDISEWISAIIPYSKDGNTSSVLAQFKEMISDMCTETKKFDDYLTALQSGNEAGKLSAETMFALNMMNHADSIQRYFRIQYLQKTFVCNDVYRVVPAETNNGEDIDKNVLLRILTGNNVIAWISVGTNIYLSAKHIHSDFTDMWSGEDGFKWIYLHPDGNKKKFNLKNPDWGKLPNRQVDISSYLDQIIF